MKRPMRIVPRQTGWPLDSIGAGLAYCYLTSAIVVLGVMFGTAFLRPSPRRGHLFDPAAGPYANWDGQWYIGISASGYRYDPGDFSSVAFFPAYPLAGGLLSRLTGVGRAAALLVLSNLCLAAVFVLSFIYVKSTRSQVEPDLPDYTLLAMGLVPTTFFFRMAYAESMFLLLVVLSLHAMGRRWPLVAIAAVVGLATATRPVGVGLIPALVLHIRHRSDTPRGAVLRSVYLIPLACWGLIAYMLYQYAAFGDPLAFARAQASWSHRPSAPFGRKVLALATLEPIRALFDPSGPGYWRDLAPGDSLLFSVRAADPAYFLVSIALVALGAARRWLTGYEWLTAGSLLLIPYVSKGYEQYVQSIGRHSSVAFPVYLVIGQLLSRAPAPLVACLAGLSGLVMGIYAALFSAWYFVV